MITIGDKIATLLSTANSSALIAAPFIQLETLERVLDCITEGVEILVVTRWRPADLLAGVSDLDIFDLTETRGIHLYLRNDLHAKTICNQQFMPCWLG